MNMPLSMSLHWLESVTTTTHTSLSYLLFFQRFSYLHLILQFAILYGEKRIKRVKPGLYMLSRLGRDSKTSDLIIYGILKYNF